MHLPDARRHRPDPDYIRRLLRTAGLSQVRGARVIGVCARTMRSYCSGQSEPPYTVQFALEVLAAHRIGQYLPQAQP